MADTTLLKELVSAYTQDRSDRDEYREKYRRRLQDRYDRWRKWQKSFGASNEAIATELLTDARRSQLRGQPNSMGTASYESLASGPATGFLVSQLFGPGALSGATAQASLKARSAADRPSEHRGLAPALTPFDVIAAGADQRYAEGLLGMLGGSPRALR